MALVVVCGQGETPHRRVSSGKDQQVRAADKLWDVVYV